ncbi:peptidylprolyl isomerase [Candidatus Woesearchaeota archaeon]|nr:peptidylprolyl isomerase [Candidatus Woesearchaeota archaeon]
MDENNLYFQRMVEQKKHHDKRKTPAWIIVFIIICVIAIIALGALLATSRSPMDSIFSIYSQQYPDSVMSVQMITGEDANALGEQIRGYCPGFNLADFYMAQFDNAAKQQSIVHIVNSKSGDVECVIDRNPPVQQSQQALGQTLLATINGEPVYAEEVTLVYNNIPAESRTNASLADAYDQVVNNKLLLQDAARKGLVVSDEEVNNAINAFLANNGLTIEQLQQNLAASGSSIGTFTVNIRNNLLLQKEVAEVTKGAPAPSEQEMMAYYDENKQGFSTVARATTHQILVYANDSNVDSKLEYVKSIAEQLNTTNFCELVTKYSEDTVTIGRCGLYEFQQGQLLPEYEDIVFNSEPGSAKIIRTRIGLHIVRIDNVTLPKQLSYEEAKPSINDYFVLRNMQSMLNQHIEQLRQEAEVVNYNPQ